MGAKKKYQRYTPKQKGEAMGLLNMGASVRQVCQQTGISMASLQSWKKQYRKNKQMAPVTYEAHETGDLGGLLKKPYSVDLKGKIQELVRDEVMRVLNEVL